MTQRLTNTLIRTSEDCPVKEPMHIRKFKSPPDEVQGMQFSTIEQVKNYMTQQQMAVGGLVSTMYRFNCQPRIENCTKIRVRCIYCTARVTLRLKSGSFVTTRIFNEHNHEEVAFDSTLEQSIFRYDRDMARRVWEKRRLKREHRMSGEGVDTYLNFQNRELLNENEQFNTWELLSKELRNKGYKWRVEWGEQPYGPYPRMMVLVSRFMEVNYRNFGEMLSFDFTYNLIRNRSRDEKRYGLGVFCVTDTNVRVLIAGLAIMCEERNEDLYKMFQHFFELHGGRYPQTVITDQQRTMEVGLQMLAQRGLYTGIHIYDPFHVVNHLRESVRGDEDAMRDSIRLVSRMIRTRNFADYQKCSIELAKDTENAPLFADFMSKAHKVCHFEIPRSFIGINRFSCEIVNDLIKVEVPYETTINRLMERLVALDGRLHLKSSEGFEIFTECVEQQLNDERVKEVRLNFQKKVFLRFLENYVRSMGEFDLVRLADERFEMRCPETNELFLVEKWSCDCDELVKTGVPCPHLIACARMTPSKSYGEMFSPRWRKTVPVLSNDKIVWTKKKYLRCERFYIPHRNRAAKVFYAVQSSEESAEEDDNSDD